MNLFINVRLSLEGQCETHATLKKYRSLPFLQSSALLVAFAFSISFSSQFINLSLLIKKRVTMYAALAKCSHTKGTEASYHSRMH